MDKKYEKIINIKYPFKLQVTRMPEEKRAAQFSAFKALNGFEEKINQKNQSPDKKPILDSDELYLLNEKIKLLMSFEKPVTVSVEYWHETNNETGIIKKEELKFIKISSDLKNIEFDNNIIIPLYNIINLQGDIFSYIESY